MPSTVPTDGFLPATFSKIAFETMHITSPMRGFSEQARDLGNPDVAERGLDHVDVRRVTGEVCLEVRAALRLRGDAVLRAVVQDRAEPFAICARHVDAVVDDDAGDALLVLRTQDAALVGALDEALLLADRVDEPQEAADPDLGRGLPREREVVGVARIGRVDFLRELREPV